MSEKFDPNSGASRPREDRSRGRDNYMNGDANGYSNGRHANNGQSSSTFDFWTALDLISHRWHWLVLGGMLGVAAFLYLGWKFIGPKYIATAELMRYETPGTSEFLKTTPLSSE